MNKESYDEITELLNQAIDFIHSCEFWNGGDDGFKARALIGDAKRKLKELMEESHD
jgi:hypothetical protein|nr:MAG TPA: hypothetical protein [Caudoviricetes sp.]